jgi:RNA polymerase sigma-70 factor (ECF subfamily)
MRNVPWTSYHSHGGTQVRKKRDRQVGVVAHAVDHRATLSRNAVTDEALRRLSPEHRQVLLECCLRRSLVAETAARLGVSPGTVNSRIHYALHALRLTLDELEAVRLED